MTTAHKPTFKPSVGGSNQGGNKLYIPTKQFSSRDLPGHLKIKVRREGQGSYKDIRKKDFKSELLARETKPIKNKNLVEYEGGENDNIQNETITLEIRSKDITSDLLDLENSKKRKKLDEDSNLMSVSNNNIFPQDKDDSFSDEDSNDNDENKNEVEGDSDMEELMKEFEKIKKMREEEKKIKEQEENEKLKKLTEEQILLGNPLLSNSSYSLKKKWFEDTVFKNQSKNENKVKKRFINDTVRSDFHRKFISKYIQ